MNEPTMAELFAKLDTMHEDIRGIKVDLHGPDGEREKGIVVRLDRVERDVATGRRLAGKALATAWAGVIGVVCFAAKTAWNKLTGGAG